LARSLAGNGPFFCARAAKDNNGQTVSWVVHEPRGVRVKRAAAWRQAAARYETTTETFMTRIAKILAATVVAFAVLVPAIADAQLHHHVCHFDHHHHRSCHWEH
jgi:hypothetical protein